MPRPVPSPAARSASSSSAHPLRTQQSQIKVLLLPGLPPPPPLPRHLEQSPVSLHLPRGRPGEGEWGHRAGTSALPAPPPRPLSLTPESLGQGRHRGFVLGLLSGLTDPPWPLIPSMAEEMACFSKPGGLCQEPRTVPRWSRTAVAFFKMCICKTGRQGKSDSFF